jgi:purine-nucleoside phosphorylase
MSAPTPHIAARPGEIAPVVLMPGDPLRAQFIAENYLTELHCYNRVRGMLGFTGLYKGRRISVQGSGMGIPSIGIYSYELYHFYGVERIIRVGSAGGIADDVEVRDLIAAMGACTNSRYADQYRLPGAFAPVASYSLLEEAVQAARRMELTLRVGNVLSSDAFYDDADSLAQWQRMHVLAVEMEAAGLYMNAARAGKEALCLLTVSDTPLKGGSLSAEERQTTFRQMMEIALEIA